MGRGPAATERDHVALRRRDGVHSLELGLEGLLHLHGIDAHLEGQAVRGDVVGALGRPFRVLAEVGVVLDLQHGLGERAVGLGRQDDTCAGCVANAADGELLLRLMDLHHGEPEDVQQLMRGDGVPLGPGDKVGVGVLLALDGLHPNSVEVLQPDVAVAGHVAQACHDGGVLVVDDVAECPAAPLPGHGIVPRLFPRVDAASEGHLVSVDLDRGGDADARSL